MAIILNRRSLFSTSALFTIATFVFAQPQQPEAGQINPRRIVPGKCRPTATSHSVWCLQRLPTSSFFGSGAGIRW